MKNIIKNIIDFMKGLSSGKGAAKKTTTVICGACQSKIEVLDFSKAIKCPHCKYKFFMKPPT